jgi:D-alanyl-D-alanine carboxypeptidase/D-alanyl-D-alanine-endopeptidase (penicillin-binding protein 4)
MLFPVFYAAVTNLFRLGLYFTCLTVLLLSACAVTKKPVGKINPLQQNIAGSAVFSSSFTGFLLYDPATRDTIYQHNAKKYFTPASNTKLFTFYAAHKMLGDSIPGLKYEIRKDSLLFWGTGDPTLLHPDLHNVRVYHFLKNRKEKLFYADAHYHTSFFGPGWGWDDYNYYYSPERSAMPIYGNVVKFTSDFRLVPRYFKPLVKTAAPTATSADIMVRDFWQNNFTYYPPKQKTTFTEEVPFRQSAAVQVQLLRDTLNRPVQYLNRWPGKAARVFYSYPADSLYKRMLQVSDNLIAEQILTLCAGTISDTLNTDRVISYIIKNYLHDLPDLPVWVDGSGLSRQNLFTPRSLVALLQKMYTEIPRQRLFTLLAVGGKTGTLRSYYKAETPFLFGKTGSLSNNYNLSGFLVTRTGRTLLFSFMNNNFVVPTATIRKEVERILTEVHQTL